MRLNYLCVLQLQIQIRHCYFKIAFFFFIFLPLAEILPLFSKAVSCYALFLSKLNCS